VSTGKGVAFSYVETARLVRLDDRCGQRVQRACVRDALVWAVSVVELFELAQGVEQVPLVADQAAVQQFAAAGLYPPFHDRVHSRHPHAAEDDVDARVREDGVKHRAELAVPVGGSATAPGNRRPRIP
jgi:hypothetical protein